MVGIEKDSLRVLSSHIEVTGVPISERTADANTPKVLKPDEIEKMRVVSRVRSSSYRECRGANAGNTANDRWDVKSWILQPPMSSLESLQTKSMLSYMRQLFLEVPILLP